MSNPDQKIKDVVERQILGITPTAAKALMATFEQTVKVTSLQPDPVVKGDQSERFAARAPVVTDLQVEGFKTTVVAPARQFDAGGKENGDEPVTLPLQRWIAVIDGVGTYYLVPGKEDGLV